MSIQRAEGRLRPCRRSPRFCLQTRGEGHHRGGEAKRQKATIESQRFCPPLCVYPLWPLVCDTREGGERGQEDQRSEEEILKLALTRRDSNDDD